jgi:hypothetical protein
MTNITNKEALIFEIVRLTNGKTRVTLQDLEAIIAYESIENVESILKRLGFVKCVYWKRLEEIL